MYRKLMASRHLCFENQWPQANYALKVYRLTRFMLSKIDGLMNLCIGKLIDSSKLALENIWTQANFALEIDGLLNLCIGKLMDYRRFYAFGHYGHFIQ